MRKDSNIIYSIVNLKGGVGKTTTAQHLAAGLTRERKKVLLIDLDVQMNLSFTLKANGNYLSIFDLLKGASISKVFQQTSAGDLIRADVRLSTLQEIPPQALKAAISPVVKKYDYIIIDTPPRIDSLIISALAASDEVIIPAITEIFSLQGIITEYELIQTVKKKYNPGLNIAGILLTNYETRGTLNQQLKASIEEQAERIGAKIFNTCIRKNVAIRKAQALRSDVFEYDPRCKAAEDYRSIVKEIMENEQQ